MQRMDDCKADDVDLCFIATSSTDFKDNIQHLVERGIDGLIIGRYVNDPHQLNDYLSKHHVPYVLLDQSEDHGYTDIIRTNEIEGSDCRPTSYRFGTSTVSDYSTSRADG